ncbi:hypothetical protein [Pseudomonas sp. LG1D9]|uniref:hypothetical protein n=1 Tax=Pseudomonas sp. LG1D9 TaxID=2083054 RepID=UPI000CF358C7|nr:hypothetical protein [Pseudomonas sp. LG1D9]
MSTEKMREEFEAKYALPAGLYWCEQSSQYVGHPQFWIFTDRLEVWINSRAAIEVELPEPYAVIGDYAACGGGRSVWDVEYAEKITDRMCKKTPVYDRAQLEAAGLKVKP